VPEPVPVQEEVVSAPAPEAPVPMPEPALEPELEPIAQSEAPVPEPVIEPQPDAAIDTEPSLDLTEIESTVPQQLPPSRPVEPIQMAPPPYYQEGGMGDSHTVQRGDTLSNIASNRMPPDVTLDQMMVALYRANRAAFIDNNINRLRTGAILKMPDPNEVRTANPREARREVRVHARTFNEWREQLATQVANRPATPAGESGGSTRAIDTVRPVEERGDRVEIGSSTTGARGGDTARLRQLEEDVVRQGNALEETTAKVKELEKINRDLNELLALRNREIAKLQEVSRAQQDAALPRTETPPPSAPVVEPAPPAVPEPPVVVSQPEPSVVTPPPEPVVEPPPAFVETPPPPPVASTPVPDPEPLTVSDTDSSGDPLLDLVTDTKTLGIGALVIILLGGFFGFRSWQRKRADIGLDTLSQDAGSIFPGESSSIYGDNGGQSVDTSTSSVIHTDFSQTGLSIDTNEGVDPVAEADVYMAYGRDSQAEEILNDALKADPKRGAIYVKLLEIYSQRQDLALFETTAAELFSRTQGQGRDWEKAAQMGRRLDPSNPLYSGKPSSGQEGNTVSAVPGLEPAIEEPTRLTLSPGGNPSASGPTLSDLDFGASPTASAANTGQLKDTMVVQGAMEEMMATKIAPPASKPPAAPMAGMQSRHVGQKPVAVGEEGIGVDFQLRPEESSVPKTGSRIDFDLQSSADPGAKAGRQPISVSISRTPSSAVASRQPAPKAANDMAAPLEFGQPPQARKPSGDKTVTRDMTATVVLPSVQGGDGQGDDVMMDLEKTSFDPNALDFDLNLDMEPPQPSSSAPASSRNGSFQPAESAESGEDAGEVGTKLELARAYEDMGDTEGALELLREVAAEGNAAQKAEARTLISKLG
jgi:pilus assembly protein FimV